MSATSAQPPAWHLLRTAAVDPRPAGDRRGNRGPRRARKRLTSWASLRYGRPTPTPPGFPPRGLCTPPTNRVTEPFLSRPIWSRSEAAQRDPPVSAWVFRCLRTLGRPYRQRATMAAQERASTAAISGTFVLWLHPRLPDSWPPRPRHSILPRVGWLAALLGSNYVPVQY